MSDLTLLTQAGWNWCQKCQGMFHSLPNSGPLLGVCPAGGPHSPVPSLPYVLPFQDPVSIRTRRWLYRGLPRRSIQDFIWDEIRHDSYVFMTAAESRDSPNPPERFIGEANMMSVYNIAPHDGGAWFLVSWEGDFPSLDVWVDVLLIN